MSKKMKIPSIFLFRKKQAWQWPSCKQHPNTLSFRATNNDDVFKTVVNSVFFDTSDDGLRTPGSWFTNSSSDCASTTFSTDEDDNNNNEAVEMIIREVRSSERRLFFEADGTSSILTNHKEMETKKVMKEESVAVAMESDDPYLDFKKSMQEMVESHGLEEWESLEDLLGWYLNMNGKHNHGFIVAAFVDVLVGMVKEYSTSYSSAQSCFSHISSKGIN